MEDRAGRTARRAAQLNQTNVVVDIERVVDGGESESGSSELRKKWLGCLVGGSTTYGCSAVGNGSRHVA